MRVVEVVVGGVVGSAYVPWLGWSGGRSWGGGQEGGGAEGSCSASPERSTSGMPKVYSRVRKRLRRSTRASGGSAANVVGLSVFWF